MAWLCFVASYPYCAIAAKKKIHYSHANPAAARGRFKPEWQTKNYYVDELAPLNRYSFIYLFTYLLIPCYPRDKQIKIPASNWSEWKEEGGTKFSVVLISFKFSWE